MGPRNSRKLAALAVELGISVSVAMLVCGCGSRQLDRDWTLADLEDPDMTARIMAVKWAGDKQVSQAVPFLVDHLENGDKALRFYSIQALRRITGIDCAYDYRASASRRAQAVACWREYLKVSGSEANGR